MRIRFSKNKQRALLQTYKKEKNQTWKQLALSLNTTEGALRTWYYEKTLLPKNIYKKLDPKETYKKYIVATLDNNWGRKKGGACSTGTTKKIKKPRSSPRLAELVGIILGDGNVHKYIDGKKKRSYMLRIAGDYRRDRVYLETHVAPLCRNLFHITPKFVYQPEKGEMFVILHSKELVNFLVSIGLKTGRKMKTQVTIPSWVKEKKSFLYACLRGLIDTDGSVHRMSKKDPHLLRINFTNHNQRLLQDTRTAFLSLGFHPSKIIRGRVFYISRRDEIGKYIKEIGFSNEKHVLRLEHFNSPVV